MYATSQRVLREHSGKTGFNTFVFKHGPQPVDNVDWRQPDVSLIADQVPGLLTAQDIEVPVGGNLIRSWLDVACPDETSNDAISKALKTFRAQWKDDLISKSVPIDGIGIRFGIQLSERDLSAELEMLSNRIIATLSLPTSGVMTSEPLQINVERGDDAMKFSLAATALERLITIHGPSWTPSSVSVGADIKVALPPQLAESLVPILTNLPLERVVQLGGVQFIDAKSGQVAWETLPRNVLVGGYCLACHQHHTLSHGGDGLYRCGFCGHAQDDDGTWVATLTG